MKADIIFFASDSLNKYGYIIDVTAFERVIKDVNKGGVPMLIAHDFHRAVGWNRPFGVLVKPGIALATASRWIAENTSDYELIISKTNEFLHARYEQCFLPVRENFLNALTSEVDQDAIKIDCGCAAIVQRNLVKKEFPNLMDDVNLDKNGLIPLSHILTEFDYHKQGVFKHKRRPLCVFAHQYFRRSQSRLNNFFFSFFDELMALSSDPNITIRLRLDPDLVGYAPSYNEIGELAYHYGPKYNDRIDQIKHGITRHQCDELDRKFSGVSCMEFYGKHEENEFTFEAEEVRDFPAGATDDHYACRYVHAIYDKLNGSFHHFDGAIRSYDFESMVSRVSQNFVEVGRKAEYLKLFRVDGRLPIDKWKTLVTHYYQENPLIYEYFDIDTSGLKAQHIEHVDSQEFLPYEIQEEDGLRIFLSYHEISGSVTEGRYIEKFDVLTNKDGSTRFIELNVFELKLALARLGEELEIPADVDFVKFGDHLWNIPAIMHSGKNKANLLSGSVLAMRNLFKSMIERGIYKTVSLTLSYVLNGRIVRISSFGSIQNQLNWLTSCQSLPMTEDDLTAWITDQRNYLDKFPSTAGNMTDDALLQHDGVLYMERVQLTSGYKLSFDEGGPSILLSESEISPEALKLCLNGIIRPVVAIKVEKIVWSDNGDDYFSSNRSKWMDKLTSRLQIRKCAPVAVFWAKPHSSTIK